MSRKPDHCHCGQPARQDGSDYDGVICHQYPICCTNNNEEN